MDERKDRTSRETCNSFQSRSSMSLNAAPTIERKKPEAEMLAEGEPGGRDGGELGGRDRGIRKLLADGSPHTPDPRL